MNLNFSQFENDLTTINNSPIPGDGSLNGDFTQQIIETRLNIFNTLNDLIYSGQYCSVNSVHTQINQLSQSIEAQKDFSMAFGVALQDYTAAHIRYVTSELYKPVTAALGLLAQLIEQIHNKFSLHPRKLVLRQSIKDNINSFDLTDKAIIDLLLFRINVFVANCDHFLSNNDSFELEKLEEIIDFFIDETLANTKRLLVKSRYIRAKILLRDAVRKKDKKRDTRDLFILQKGQLYPFDPKSNSDLYPYFSMWIDHMIDHYELTSDWRNSIVDRVDQLRLLPSNTVTAMHLRIKCYKDVECNLEDLKKLTDNIRPIYEVESTEQEFFNQYAYKISFSYCLNNYFSLLCQVKPDNFLDIENEYERIRTISEIKEIKNYFPETRYLRSLLNNFDNLFAQGKDGYEKIDDCKELISKANITVERYEENIRWVKNNYNYIFQLPFSECFVEIDSQKLFVFSSFVLPIDRDHLEIEFDNNKLQLNTYEASLSIYKATSILYHSYQDLKEENERKDSKNVEILGLFVAIVTFTAGVIPGFKFINTGAEAIYFTLALGLSMSGFAVTLYILGRQRNQEQGWWKIIVTLTIFFVLSFSLWMIAYYNMESSFRTDKYIEEKVGQALKNQLKD